MATFRKRDPYQWQAMVRKKGQPLQTRTSETRAQAEQWARAIEVETDKGVSSPAPRPSPPRSGTCWSAIWAKSRL